MGNSNSPQHTSEAVQIIEDEASLRSFVERAQSHQSVAIDIESNGFYNYVEKTCIITASLPELDVVIDSLTLWDSCQLLGPLFSNPDIQTLVHGGSYDVASMKRDWGFSFANLFDTNIAAQILGLEKQGLAGLVEQFAGVKLPKELQRYDWTIRPLKPNHISYLAGDTHYLFLLRDEMKSLLDEKDLHEEFVLECEVIAAMPASSLPQVDGEEFRKIKGLKNLTDDQRGVVKALFQARDEIARELDMATFRVLSNAAILTLAQESPTSLDHLADIRGVGRSLRERFGTKLLQAIEDGIQDPQPRKRPRIMEPRVSPLRRITPEQRQLEKDLKSWRRNEAERRGIGIQGVLPTQVLQQIVRELPVEESTLKQYERLGKSRTERYGPRILEIVRQLTA